MAQSLTNILYHSPTIRFKLKNGSNSNLTTFFNFLTLGANIIVTYLLKFVTANFFFTICLTSIVLSSAISMAQTPKTAAPDLSTNFLKGILDQIKINQPIPVNYKPPIQSLLQLQNLARGEIKLWLSYWKFFNFNYPLFIQTNKSDIVYDFYLAFPSYILHDPILKLLQTQLGTQSTLLHQNNSSIYQWKLAQGETILYEAHCAVTCYAGSLAMDNGKNDIKGYTTFWKTIQKR